MTESNRNSLMLAGDAIRRSMTRNSHYSHASTHSWVISNQQNPPPPPPDEPLPSSIRPLPDPAPSPARTPRPLPDPQLQSQHHHQFRTTNADPTLMTPEDEEEYMNIDPDVIGMESGYLTEGLGRGRRPIATSPMATDETPGRERGFVGGFVSGLRRLPRVVLKYRNLGDKRMYFRRTYGSGGTLTNGTITNGTDTVNTLPLYASNPPTPVAGPSNTRYVEALEMPVPHSTEAPALPILGPSLSERRQHLSFRISPPSGEVAEQELTSGPLVDSGQANTPAPVMPGRISNTVTIYNLPDQEDYRPEEPSLPLPTSTPNPQSPNPRSPAASIPAEAQSQSPVRARPSPTADYLKMTSSPHSTGTMSTSLSSEPSFSSQLSPVKSFFVKLYHLPWIALDRVTEDYRPDRRDRRNHVSSGVKKPMASWYRGQPGVVLSVKNGSGEIDLLSSNSSSRRASTGTSSTPLSSPALQVRHRSSDHQRTHSRESRRRRHLRDPINTNRSHGRRRHRHNAVVSTTDTQLQTDSPMIPAMYPYPYPFPVAYPTFSIPPPPQPQRTQSHSTPRGPRPHRTPMYPHGYVPYQPPQPPPPVFVLHSPAQSASSVEGSHAPTQVMSPMYVPMSLVPGALPQETTHQTASTPAASFPATPPTGEAVPNGGI